MSTAPRLAAFATGAVGSAVALRLLRRWPPGGEARWSRTNHAGEPVTLLEGPAYVAGAAVAAAAGAAAAAPSAGLAAAVAGLGSGAFGALDDLAGDSASKGLRGHLGALRQGRVTTGAVKIAGLALTGLLAAALVDRGRGHGPQPATGPGGPGERTAASATALAGPMGTLVGGAVVAGCANVVNLLDLRPGRALKVALAAGATLAARDAPGAVAAAAVAGACAGALPPDLAGQAMLGDTGANSAGAGIGTALIARLGLRGRLVALGVVTALTVASEKVSFTRVIESTPGLRELDALGRRPRG